MMYCVKHDLGEHVDLSVQTSQVSILFCMHHLKKNYYMIRTDFVCDAGTFRTGVKECTKVQKILESHKEKRCTGR